MSSATATRTRIVLRLRLLLRAVWWTLLAAVLAVAAAGLVAKLWHPAGGPARAELTWIGDVELTGALDASEVRVLEVAARVDELADEARLALASVAASDPALLEESLSRGTVQAAAIQAAVVTLREALRALPGDEPDAALHYRSDLVLRRAALLAAIEAAAGLPGDWGAVRARSRDIAALLDLIATHDGRVLDAAAAGRESRYRRAISTLEEAAATLVAIEELRAKLVTGTEPTVLDDWVDRNRTYDQALSALYQALRESDGEATVEVLAAARAERIALQGLPADRRAIIVIISEVARGGLNQAVLAIEETRGRIDAALAVPTEDLPDDTPGGGG